MGDQRFEDFLRRGGDTPRFADAPTERKFNPYHDPDDGRFTFAPGRGTLAPRVRSLDSAGMMNRVQNPPVGPGRPRISSSPRPSATGSARSADHSSLSARYESSGSANPGAVSNSPNDRGGVSYGSYQLATNPGTVADFIASSEAKRWSGEFRGLTPGSAAFSKKWREVAAKEPGVFHIAQKSYIDRTHYQAAANSIAKRTGLNIDGRSEALRQVVYSTAVHHGASGGTAVITAAVAQTDKFFRRSDPRYERSLIDSIYDLRVARVKRNQDIAKKKGDNGRAHDLGNILKNRFPDERKRALGMLSGG